MIVLIDNYDSFTYNLYQLLGEHEEEIVVVRNDEITIEQLEEVNPRGIVLSPGPGKPEDAGICINVIRHFYKNVPILGICLGHQAIIAAFGGDIVRAECIKHGKTSRVKHNGTSIFSYATQPLTAMRYHSLVAEQTSLPECFDILATAMDDGDNGSPSQLLSALRITVSSGINRNRRRRKVNTCLLTEIKEEERV